MNKDAIESLLALVKAAKGPNRKIDYALYLLVGNEITNSEMLSADQRRGHLEAFAPSYTASLDAIVGLIEEKLPDLRLDLHSPRLGQIWEAVLSGRGASRTVIAAHAATGPLALLAAFLTALLSEQKP